MYNNKLEYIKYVLNIELEKSEEYKNNSEIKKIRNSLLDMLPTITNRLNSFDNKKNYINFVEELINTLTDDEEYSYENWLAKQRKKKIEKIVN